MDFLTTWVKGKHLKGFPSVWTWWEGVDVTPSLQGERIFPQPPRVMVE